MASNPIQKKVRNAGLIGAAITLLVMGAIVAFLLVQLINLDKEQKEVEASYQQVYTLNKNVKSGQLITTDMLQLSTAQVQHIPSNATSNIETFVNYALVDDAGNNILSDEKGAFLSKDCDYVEIYDDGKGGYYTYSNDGQKEKINGIDSNDIHTDKLTGKEEKYIIKKANKKTRLYKEIETDEYYILVLNGTNRVKQTVKIFGTPLIAKIDMEANTILTTNMVSKGTPVLDDVRKQEYNAVVLPADLTTGDYIDIRIQLPSGQDYIVVSKKCVELPIINGTESESTIWLELSEDEILSMSCAIVEAYKINGAKLYATKYTDPGMQEAATPTYPLSAETVTLIQANPNVTQAAEQSLLSRYTEAMVSLRNNYINPQLGNSTEDISGKINESIVKTQEERKEYLESLTSGEDEDY